MISSLPSIIFFRLFKFGFSASCSLREHWIPHNLWSLALRKMPKRQKSVKANGGINGSISMERASNENIFLFIPNLIGMSLKCYILLEATMLDFFTNVFCWRCWNHTGYFRIILATASLYYMPLHPRTCSLLYSISCLLDALDGYAARRFNQSTRFGAVLDMVTDRCTTACLLVFLSSAFPRWSLLFQGLISLDLASHYMHMYATLTMGGGPGQSHKKVDDKRSWILKQYYSDNVSLWFKT